MLYLRAKLFSDFFCNFFHVIYTLGAYVSPNEWMHRIRYHGRPCSVALWLSLKTRKPEHTDMYKFQRNQFVPNCDYIVKISMCVLSLALTHTVRSTCLKLDPRRDWRRESLWFRSITGRHAQLSCGFGKSIGLEFHGQVIDHFGQATLQCGFGRVRRVAAG
jgi:hypothetical protein